MMITKIILTNFTIFYFNEKEMLIFNLLLDFIHKNSFLWFVYKFVKQVRGVVIDLCIGDRSVQNNAYKSVIYVIINISVSIDDPLTSFSCAGATF